MEIDRFTLDLETPLETGSDTLAAREGWVVRIRRGGLDGYGEATPLPGFTESVPECRAALEAAAEAVAENGLEAAKNTFEPDATPAAAHGFSVAVLDAGARALDQPLYRVLGGESTETVPVNATIGAGTRRETVRAAERAVAVGFDCLKLKVGRADVATDVKRVEAVRDAVGRGVELRADANGAWTERQAERALDGFAPVEVALLEQPLAPENLHGHAELAGGVVPIALDEGFARYEYETIQAADAADALVIKPMAHGSMAAARATAKRARSAGLTVIITTTIDGVVARTGAVHLAASLGTVPACGLATADMLASDLGPDPAPVNAGEMLVPQGPGLGVSEVTA